MQTETRERLQHLLDRWPNPSAQDIDSDKSEEFLSWLAVADPKDVMRLGWHLGIERDIGKLFDLWTTDWSNADLLRGALQKGQIPRSIELAFWRDTVRCLSPNAFVPLSSAVEPAGRLLLHFTWNPAALFLDGFLGTPDPAALEATFTLEKKSPGYNFAFEAEGFDAASHGHDNFYGDDAVIFRAPHIRTYNWSSGDEEVVFWGRDSDLADFVHVRREGDNLDSWSVVDRTGRGIFDGGSIQSCVGWIAENEHRLSGTLKGPREYVLRTGSEEEAETAPAL